MQRLRKLNLTVESIDGEISVPNEKEQCILESGMEPIFEPELGMGQNSFHPYSYFFVFFRIFLQFFNF